MSASEYQYDNNGNLTERVIPSNVAHATGFNGVDRVVSETSPLRRTTEYQHNREHDLTVLTLPSGDAIRFGYAGGKLATIASPEGTAYYTYGCGSQIVPARPGE